MPRKGIALTALLVLTACFSMQTAARADFYIVLTDGGTSVTVNGSDGTTTGGVAAQHVDTSVAGEIDYRTTTTDFNHFAVNITVTSKFPNASSGKGLSDIEINTTNNSGSSDTLVLKVYSLANSGTVVNGVLNDEDAAFNMPGGSSLVLHTGLTSNSKLATGESTSMFSTLVSTVSTTGDTATVTGPTTGSSSDNKFNTAPNAASEYGLENELDLTLNAGSTVTLTGTTDVAAVPAPSTWVLSCAGLVFAGGGCWLQRRRQRARLQAI